MKVIIATALVGLVCVGGGCQFTQRVQNSPPELTSSTPMIVDGAMQIREWDRSTALYSNGDTVAGPTGFRYEARWYQPEWRYPIIETPLFVGQTLALPVTLALTPPWSEMRYTGVTVEPTHTAMPLLPPSSEPSMNDAGANAGAVAQ
jgi:hypothetical protein